jgi:adenosylcobinamide-phosphate synthase
MLRRYVGTRNGVDSGSVHKETVLHIEFAIAFIIDLLIGDPEYPFHPVRLIGKGIARLENAFRKIAANQKMNGFLFFVCIVSGTFAIVYALVFISGKLDGLTGLNVAKTLVVVYFIYSGLCMRDLRDKAMEIERLLEEGNIRGARERLAFIVGRDTEHLDEKEIVRATVETVAENITDGIISPLFYALLGGAPLMMAYKAVSTLDSMVGYKNERYLDFGFASAKADDIANFIPARISACVIPVVALFTGGDAFRSLRTAIRDGGKNPSPNSGVSEAAVAGALGVRLGGTSCYNGERSDKPVIGDAVTELRNGHIHRSVTIAYGAGFLFFAIVLFLTSLS